MRRITTHDVFGRAYEAGTDDLELSVHVYGLAVDGNKVLISPQWDGYDFPGGTVKKGETHIETLKREFKEETGYDVEPVELLDFRTSFFHHHMRMKDYQSYLVFYRVKIVGGELSDSGFDAGERQYAEIARWATFDELKNMRFASNLDIADELLVKLVK